jgi:hypothetical protein
MRRNSLTLCVVTVLAAMAIAACDKSSPSSPSAPSSNCSQLTLTPSTQSFPGGGGTGTIVVTTPAGCAWSVTAPDTWLTLTSVGSGSGAGSVAFSVAANPLLSSRTGTIRIGSSQAAVSQDGTPNDPSCRFELRPASRSISAAGGNFLVMVFAPFGCRWTFASGPAWLQIVPEGEGAPNGNGNGSVEAHVAANPDPAPRSGQASIAGLSLSVVQDGQAAAACTYALSPPTQAFVAAGGAATLSIATAAGCSWRLDAEQGAEPWVSVNQGQRGSGPAVIPYTVLPNRTFAGRVATIVVTGDSGNARPVQTVTQAAATCLYTVSPAQAAYGWSGNWEDSQPYWAKVTTSPSDCSWTARSEVSWMEVPSSTGRGAGWIGYRVRPNTGVDARKGTIVVSGLTGVNPTAVIEVTQTVR